MKGFFKNLYIQKRFFYAMIGVIAVFVVSFPFPQWFFIAKLILLILCSFLVIDIFLVHYKKNGIIGSRKVPEKFSNGDLNTITLQLQNEYPFATHLAIIDEIPEQFQKRDFLLHERLQAYSEKNIEYHLRPTTRGVHHFGNLNIYVASPLGLAAKRYIFSKDAEVPVYPSFIQLKKYNFVTLSNQLSEHGVHKIRRIGHTMEFEQIKDYVSGDDIRSINWKATAKRNQLMVNQYLDERSQLVYSVIDKGRMMKMPFNGMSLLDYAINASLVISNVVLKKQDKAGIFTFSKKVENMVVAERRATQLSLILEALYNVKTNYFESDFSRLYTEIRRNITHRGLMLLYTNFETMDGLHRQLPYLKAIAKKHLLVVVFFKNTELRQLIFKEAKTIEDVYDKTIAEKFSYEKKLIVKELRKHGIQSILTSPEELIIDTINKYLEIKSRNLL